MAGLSSDSSPDPAPAIWLCREGLAESPRLPGWLTAYERQTADKFSGPRRREYLASRWLIRQALASASGQRATDCCPVDGRPVRSATPTGWSLSLSHSHELSACATGGGRRIGLDLEPCSRHPHWQRIARRWFSPGEQEWLLGHDDADHFLRVWTLKEAWLKATGRGIAGNLQTLEVGPDYELSGDLRDPDWQAGCWRVDGFFVTLVWQQSRPARPEIGWFPTPPSDLHLTDAQAAPVSATEVLRKPIHPAP